MVKDDIKRLWTDTCDVIIREEITDPISHLTSFQESIKYQNEPCRISYKNITSITDSDVAKVQQITKLIIDSTLDIPPGCKIIVTHKGLVKEFTRSGEPAIYTNHQELILKLFKRWS